jgi:hypothetical protein
VASKSLTEWLKMLWEIWGNECVVRFVSCCVVCLALCRVSLFVVSRPLRQGGSSSFYRPRRERITCMPRYLAT